ncbi:hypothetical protein LDC_2682, partial [sediment metagenome]
MWSSAQGCSATRRLTVQARAHEIEWLARATAPSDEDTLLDCGAALALTRGDAQLGAYGFDHRADILGDRVDAAASSGNASKLTL